MAPDIEDAARPKKPFAFQRGPHWVALCAAVFTLPLLYVGGSVTTYRVGLAVPDWPQTFGINMFLYDFWNAPFGVRVEHTHRLYGAAVGMATIFLTGWFLAVEERRWMKGLGVLALLAVIIQGLLGGTRVTQVSTLLAAVHGVVGQAFFGLMVALCVFTGRRWYEHKQELVDAEHLRRRSLWLLVLVVAQIALGSWLRHYGSPAVFAVHGVMALAVWAHVIAFFFRVKRGGAPQSVLFRSALAATVAASLQIALGIVAMIYLLPFDGFPRPVSFYQAVIRTGHQTNGALLLAAAVVMVLRTFRLFAGSTARFSPEIDRDESRLKPAAVDWEAVA
jgi:cytochrome c oxidase assembly protein subunit 15